VVLVDYYIYIFVYSVVQWFIVISVLYFCYRGSVGVMLNVVYLVIYEGCVIFNVVTGWSMRVGFDDVGRVMIIFFPFSGTVL